MALNLNERVFVLGAVSATDVSVVGGSIFVKGADPINTYKVQGVPQYFGTSAGYPGVFTIISAAGASVIAAATTYSGVIQQVFAGETINFPFSYTTGASAPTAANFYIAVAAVIQAGIDGGAVFGTLTNSASGVVFTGTAEAPVIAFASSNLSVSQASTAISVTGTFTNATPRVLTAAAHGLTVGAVYNVTISGTDSAELNGRTYPCIPTSTSLISFIGTSATGAVDITSAVFTKNNNAVQTFYPEAGRMTGYDATKPYVGLQVSQVSEAAVESGVVIPEVILVDATVAVNPTATLGAFFGAINAGLV
jgi:hypothetical protein